MRGCEGCGRPVPPKGVLLVDTKRVEVLLDGREVRVNNAEFLIAEQLARASGRVVRRNTLEQSASLAEAAPSRLNVTIHALRRKLGAARIAVVPKVGYRMEGRTQVI